MHEKAFGHLKYYGKNQYILAITIKLSLTLNTVAGGMRLHSDLRYEIESEM